MKEAPRIVMKATFLALALSTAASASGPDDQFGYQRPIVRIYYTDGMGNQQFNGTGTVVANTNANGQGSYCVLTADHVIANGGPPGMVRPGLGIAFGQYKQVALVNNFVPMNGAIMPAMLAGRLGPPDGMGNKLADMAVLNVPYGNYNQDNDKYVMPVAPFMMDVGYIFSSAGYGRIGNRLIENAGRPMRPAIPAPGMMFWNGFVAPQMGSIDYTQRFWYNSVNRLLVVDDNAIGRRGSPYPEDPYREVEPYPGSEPPDGIWDNPRQGYKYDAVEFDLTAPTELTATVGEGIGFSGDSCATYMVWNGTAQMVTGIHTYSYYLVEGGGASQKKLWNFEGGGVRLTFAYQAWIAQQCAPPPCMDGGTQADGGCP